MMRLLCWKSKICILHCWEIWLVVGIFALYKSNRVFFVPFHSVDSWVSALNGGAADCLRPPSDQYILYCAKSLSDCAYMPNENLTLPSLVCRPKEELPVRSITQTKFYFVTFTPPKTSPQCKAVLKLCILSIILRSAVGEEFLPV